MAQLVTPSRPSLISTSMRSPQSSRHAASDVISCDCAATAFGSATRLTPPSSSANHVVAATPDSHPDCRCLPIPDCRSIRRRYTNNGPEQVHRRDKLQERRIEGAGFGMHDRRLHSRPGHRPDPTPGRPHATIAVTASLSVTSTSIPKAVPSVASISTTSKR